MPPGVAEINEQAIDGGKPYRLQTASQARCPKCLRGYPEFFAFVRECWFKFLN